MMFAGTSRMLLVLPAVALLCILAVRRFATISKAVALLASNAHLQTLLQGFSTTRHRVKLALTLVAAGALLITMLQPRFGQAMHTVQRQGRDVMIALDISRSMQARDVKPTRLVQAKLKVAQLVQGLAADRVGLILFAGSAMVQCPLTADHDAFNMFLDGVDTETRSSGTTAIDRALAAALDCYKNQNGRKSKLVVLVTDGEDFSRNFATVKRQAAEEGIVIAALGMGTPAGAPVPKIDFYGKQVGHEVDADGKPALTKLNEELLASLAKELGGIYVRAQPGTQDIAQIQAFIERFESEQIGEHELETAQEQYPWFAGLAALLLGLEWIL